MAPVSLGHKERKKGGEEISGLLFAERTVSGGAGRTSTKSSQDILHEDPVVEVGSGSTGAGDVSGRAAQIGAEDDRPPQPGTVWGT